MHMYITSALQKTDMKAVGLQLALELLHEKVKHYYRFFVLVFHLKNSIKPVYYKHYLIIYVDLLVASHTAFIRGGRTGQK